MVPTLPHSNDVGYWQKLLYLLPSSFGVVLEEKRIIIVSLQNEKKRKQ
jgi:hypothetical protein